MKITSTTSQRNASAHNFNLAKKSRRSAILLAAAASTLLAQRGRADTYYLQPNTGSSPFDWNSFSDVYYTWRDITTNGYVDVPTPGATVYLYHSGTNGVSNTTVNLNYSYGTNAIASFYIDSGNAISQTSGTSLMNTSSNSYIGYSGGGIGQYSQSAGTTTIGGWLYLGNFSGSFGTYTLSGSGTLNVTSGIEEIGNSGVGVFNQSGGVNNAGTLVVGNNLVSGASGTYNMSNGATLNVSANLSVGDSGIGTFNMTGGTINIATNGTLGLVIGDIAGSSGTVTVSGGTINLVPNYIANIGIRVGNGGVGQMVQSGGQITSEFVNLASNSSYSLSGGILSTDYQNIPAAAVFTQSGGNNKVNSLFIYGGGSYTLSGGLLNQGTGLLGTDYAGECIASSGNGSFSQSGGTNLLTNFHLYVGGYYYFNGNGTYTLSNGLLQLTNGLDEVIGDGPGSIGTFNQSGGTNIDSGTVYISYNDDGGYGAGTFNLSGGVLIAGTVQVNVNGLFNQTGGTLDATVFNLAGGTVTGSLQNLGTFNYSSGNFLGRLINQGTVNLGISFTAGNGIENDTTMTIPAASTVNANGAGLDNLGTLNLQLGGTLGGTGPIINDFGGVMNAAGTVAGPFLNNGQLNLNGLLTLSGVATNVGVINIASTESLRTSGLTNSGTIDVTGGSVSGTGTLTNSSGGLIEGGGGIATLLNNGGLIYATSTAPLVITTLTGNLNGGELRVSNNATLTITNPFSSSGVVTLQGNNASFSGGAMTNTGTIQGAGRLTDSVVNTGIIRASGGELTFSAAGIVNNAPGQIQAASGNIASFTQGLTNAGTIALAGGTLDTGSAILNNTGQLLGNGTVTTGGMLNSGTLFLSDVPSAVYGAVTNTGQIQLTANTTDFYGFVNNSSGTISTSSAIARYLAGASIGGSYKSDPSQNYFTELTVTSTGALIGGSGDKYIVSNDYSSASTQTAEWNTQGALLDFTGGGTHSVNVTSPSSSTFAWGTMQVDGANIANISGNGLVASTTTNAGSIEQISGSSSLGALSGTGNLVVGGFGTNALTAVNSLSQSAVTLASGSLLNIGAPSVFSGSGVVTSGGLASPVLISGALTISGGSKVTLNPSIPGSGQTNSVGSLSIDANSLLDMGNHTVIVQNAPDEAVIRSYLAQAYAGGAWTGTSGITSSVVEANPSALSIAYVSGANTNNAALNPALTNTSAVLLRPSLIGDFNLDGKVDRFDIRQFNARNAFNDGLTTHDWADGDLNGDGKVDRFDIRILNASNNFNSGNTFVAQAQTLSSSVSPATGNSINNPTTVGTVGDGKPDLIYNPSTGDVVFSYDGYNPGTGKELVEIDVQSSKSDLNPSGANTSAAQFVSKASNDVDYQDVGTGIADGVDLGTIMPVGSTPAALTNGDIVVNLYLNGEGTSNKYADITSTPEPTTLTLMGLAAAGLLGRRRKNPK